MSLSIAPYFLRRTYVKTRPLHTALVTCPLLLLCPRPLLFSLFGPSIMSSVYRNFAKWFATLLWSIYRRTTTFPHGTILILTFFNTPPRASSLRFNSNSFRKAFHVKIMRIRLVLNRCIIPALVCCRLRRIKMLQLSQRPGFLPR